MKKSNRGFELLRTIFAFLRGTTKHAESQTRFFSTSEAHALPSASNFATEQNDPPDIASLRPVKELFVVWDALGDGRLVGVFTSEEQAQQIQHLNPFYYRHYRCYLGEPTDLALHWLEEPARQQLKNFCRQFRQ